MKLLSILVSFLSILPAINGVDFSVPNLNSITILEENNNNIYFYGPVNQQSSFQLKKLLEKSNSQSQSLSIQYNIDPPPIHLHIQSEGGSLFHTLYIVDLIKNLKTPVYTYIDGFAASAATLISTAGKKRFITKTSLMLIHQLSASNQGKYEELKDEFTNLSGLMDIIKRIYTENTKIPKNKLEQLLRQDIWLTSYKCLEYGLVDKIL